MMIIEELTQEEASTATEKGLSPLDQFQRREIVWSLLEEWRPKSDTLSFYAGPLVAATSSAFLTLPLMKSIRIMHRLEHIKSGRILFLIPSIFVGAVGGAGAQLLTIDQIITRRVQCSVCLELRSVTTQLLAGFVLPVLSTVAAAHLNLGHLHVKTPLNKEFVHWIRRIYKRNALFLGGFAALQIIFISFITYKQYSDWDYIENEYDRRRKADVKPRPKLIMDIPRIN